VKTEVLNTIHAFHNASMRPNLKLLLIPVLLTFSFLSHARLIRIIHTNDLHSYFTGYYTGLGGYAKVRTKIKEIREEAQMKGIEVIHLDAGDWGEGTSFYHSNQGVDSIRALQLLGVDVATIGNHDHMMGGKVLGQQIRKAGVKTKFTVANIKPTPSMDLRDVVSPFVDLERAGISVRIIGLTTAQAFFQYTMAPGKILDPVTIGENQGRAAKKSGRELVIALTHIGMAKDIELAKKSSSIDLIIGGHTHSKLNAVYWSRNRYGRSVPIVQAWAHGLGVGSLLLDVDDKGLIHVVDYELHEIDVSVAPDPEMQEFVKKSIETRNRSFPFDWNEAIGESEGSLTGYISGHPVYRKSCWGYHLATAAREAAGATVGIHVASFEGVFKPAGPVTMGDIADQFPHFRNFGDQGWEIATVRLPGWLLRPVMYIVSRLNLGVTFSGLGYNNKGQPVVEDKAMYTVAFPAEVAFAVHTSMPSYRHFFRGLKFTGKYYWPVMSDYVKRHSPLKCQ
jgi:2',3'-cyclic-nucleotide 2'-phosphodiesterase (5'-nucleotidase family)